MPAASDPAEKILELTRSFANVNWNNDETGSKNDEIYSSMPMDEWEEYLDLKASNGPDAKFEGVAKKGFKTALKNFAQRRDIVRGSMKPLEKQLKQLRAEIGKLNILKQTAIRTMASGSLRRVEAPVAAQTEVGFGAVGDESLMMGVITVGAASDAFNALYSDLKSNMPDLEDWTCTPEAAGLPEKDLLGMCPGGRLHIDLPPLSQEDVNAMTPQALIARALKAGIIDKEAAKAALEKIPKKEAKDEPNEVKDPKEENKQLFMALGPRVKASRCTCQICEYELKLPMVQQQIKEVGKELQALKIRKEQCEHFVRILKQALRSLGAGRSETEDEHRTDPVFANQTEAGEEAFAHDEDQLQCYRDSRAEWARLSDTLCVEDFPLRVCFLDKSGSMGCDAVTFDALKLATHNCINPERGATLTFLFAGPGETQIILRRPGDEKMQFEIQLGSSTWFNDPIFYTLEFLAPLFDQLDTAAWMKERGEPPLQVLCLTDGMDNMSRESMSSIPSLLKELKTIRGPESGQQMYMPLSGRIPMTGLNAKVPVWMAWICVGMGGNALLNSKAAKEIIIIDAIATPQLQDFTIISAARERNSSSANEAAAGSADQVGDSADREKSAIEKATTASRARQRMCKATVSDAEVAATLAAAPRWMVGHRVRIMSTVPGKPPKSAVVLNALEQDEGAPEYEILYDDETKVTVSASQIVGAPKAGSSMLLVPQRAGSKAGSSGASSQQGLQARTASASDQRLQVLAVVNSATKDLAAMMQSKNPPSSRASLEEVTLSINGSEEICEEVANALNSSVASARQGLNILPSQAANLADPTQTLLAVLTVAGQSTAKLMPEDRLIAQRFVSVGLEMLVAGGSFAPARAADQLGHFVGLMEANSKRRIPIAGDELDAWYTKITQPLKDLVGCLKEKGLVDITVNDGIDMVSALDDARSSYMGAWRFFDPSITRSGMEDSLRRAVNRFQRLQPAFSFATSTGSRRGSPRGSRRGSKNSTAAIEELPEELADGEECEQPPEQQSTGSRPASASGATTPGGTKKLPPIVSSALAASLAVPTMTLSLEAKGASTRSRSASTAETTRDSPLSTRKRSNSITRLG